MEDLIKMTEAFIAKLEWLNNCPFREGQPFYETAMHELETDQNAIETKSLEFWPDWDIMNDETLFDPHEEEINCWKAYLERLNT